MAGSTWTRYGITFEFASGDLTGAIGDSVTVLPVVVAIAALTDLSLAPILLWFGAFQIAWGLHYGLPLSVEPMKALAGLLLAGALSTGEFLVAGLLAGVVLLAAGATGTIERLADYVGEPVVRGVQFAVALLLVEAGVGLGLEAPLVAGASVVLVVGVLAVGYRNLAALVVLLAGFVVAVLRGGMPSATVPAVEPLAYLSASSLTRTALDATVAQLGMTVGNAAVATSLLLEDYFDRDVSPDRLSTSMGAMCLLAVPAGGLPMCHGSGGVAGKYAFGARTATANLALGVAYVAVALGAVGLVMAFPLAMLGVILVLVAIELARTSFRTSSPGFVVAVGVAGALLNVGVSFVVGGLVYLAVERLTGD